ncbi:hypothetical protein PPL_07029 [Heterostelium album PN500]|uniref:Nuclear speckle splicing regulatory protein 1 N-terminal domain-containing protein n=1 Tax=Heterostelium pallidum (strain ATCC 26659 / Pp 5 / PN500) TaxID=670386 RepID=D3BE76_HETP5|nr:hypothetical protein PPL_07029 [Heterostelium album PN500]EFA80207.1 hypothetical protein PPL_07029 [Heterostelium album PN500]|eukprot:XP_020432327.1 hypothetical protein PPL_07029 [Heterostelium album PN500]
MQVGEGGKKYGLQLPTKLKSAFKDDSDDDHLEDDDTSEQQKKQPTDYLKQQRDAKTKIEKLHNAALEEDSTVFDYDGVYDQMKKQEKQTARKQQQSMITGKPKYIQNLMAEADRKKRENERVKDRIIQKEREAEGDLYKDKEVFLTSGYKKKLEERKRQEEIDRQAELSHDVTKKKDLSDFHRNLYNTIVDNNDDNSSNQENINNNNNNSSKNNEKEYNNNNNKRKQHYYAPVIERKETVKEVIKQYPRRNDEDSINAARERYLQRKLNRNK